MSILIGEITGGGDAFLERELANYAGNTHAIRIVKLANSNELASGTSSVPLDDDTVEMIYDLPDESLMDFRIIVHGFTEGAKPFCLVYDCVEVIKNVDNSKITFLTIMPRDSLVPENTVFTGLQLMDNNGNHLLRRHCLSGLYNGGQWKFRYEVKRYK